MWRRPCEASSPHCGSFAGKPEPSAPLAGASFSCDLFGMPEDPLPPRRQVPRQKGTPPDHPAPATGTALADLARYGLSGPDPDDIDLDAVDADEVALFRRLAKGTELLAALNAGILRR